MILILLVCSSGLTICAVADYLILLCSQSIMEDLLGPFPISIWSASMSNGSAYLHNPIMEISYVSPHFPFSRPRICMFLYRLMLIIVHGVVYCGGWKYNFVDFVWGLLIMSLHHPMQLFVYCFLINHCLLLASVGRRFPTMSRYHDRGWCWVAGCEVLLRVFGHSINEAFSLQLFQQHPAVDMAWHVNSVSNKECRHPVWSCHWSCQQLCLPTDSVKDHKSCFLMLTFCLLNITINI